MFLEQIMDLLWLILHDQAEMQESENNGNGRRFHLERCSINRARVPIYAKIGGTAKMKFDLSSAYHINKLGQLPQKKNCIQRMFIT